MQDALDITGAEYE